MLKFLVFILLLTTSLACSTTNHNYMRGTVVMKIDQKTVHICLGENEVKAKDRIIFYFNNCERNDPELKGLKALCRLQRIGSGVVSKTLNSHYSEVALDGDFQVSEGTLAQKE